MILHFSQNRTEPFIVLQGKGLNIIKNASECAVLIVLLLRNAFGNVLIGTTFNFLDKMVLFDKVIQIQINWQDIT